MNPRGCVLALVALLAASGHANPPNIVILLADDVALTDFGAYGGEARTPNIDGLAARGSLFTQFRTSPQCAPSRAMLLTGMDNHRTGLGAIPEVLPQSHADQPGYTMHLEEGVETIAVRLKREGYRTYMTGKWHLGHGPGDLPSDHGFDRSYVLDASGADNWDDRPYMPLYADAPWYEDGAPVDLPDDFYSSEFLVDRMIEYLGEAPGTNAPFLAYVAFQAIHIPVQAPEAFIAHYDGVYDVGWHAVRRQRHARAVEVGLIPEGAPLGDMHPALREWDALDPAKRAVMTRSMEVNAGMLEAMDFHIGRLVRHLKEQGAYDNTIFVVTSDNGPEGSEISRDGGGADTIIDLWLKSEGYTERRVEKLGGPDTMVAIGPEWASAAASPSHLYKFHGAEGALRVPLIMAGPGVPRGTRINARAIMPDIMPTLLELAGADAPAPDARPLTGRSLRPVLAGERSEAYGEADAYGIEVAGNVGFYRGRYKLTRSLPPMGDGAWRVFDLQSDPGETRDLSVDRADLLDDMLVRYAAWSEDVGVIEMPEGYTPLAQIRRNLGSVMLQRYWPWLTGAIVMVLLLLWGIAAALRRVTVRRRVS
ncbi:MAG: arylsulfatase [Pseudomonadota bacterium]|nr:arylsulfatase [Pseudomonadota bacterium]